MLKVRTEDREIFRRKKARETGLRDIKNCTAERRYDVFINQRRHTRVKSENNGRNINDC